MPAEEGIVKERVVMGRAAMGRSRRGIGCPSSWDRIHAAWMYARSFGQKMMSRITLNAKLTHQGGDFGLCPGSGKEERGRRVTLSVVPKSAWRFPPCCSRP